MNTIQNTILVLLVVGGLLLMLAGNGAGIILMIIAMIIGMLKDTYPYDKKRCPYCAEYLKEEAILCRYCGKDQPVRKKMYDESKHKYDIVQIKRGSAVVFSVIISLFVVIRANGVNERLVYLNDHLDYNSIFQTVVSVIAILTIPVTIIYILKLDKTRSIFNKMNAINISICLIMHVADDRLLDIGASFVTADQEIVMSDTIDDDLNVRLQKIKIYNQQLDYKIRAIEILNNK